MIKYQDYENEHLIADGAYWDGLIMPDDPYNDFIPHEGDECVTREGRSWVRECSEENNLNTWSIVPILNDIEYHDDYDHS